MIIAHFNAGKSSIRIRPEGTVEPGAQEGLSDSTRSPLELAFQPSLRDSRHWRCGPRVKTRGYYPVSLRDKCGRRVDHAQPPGQVRAVHVSTVVWHRPAWVNWVTWLSY